MTTLTESDKKALSCVAPYVKEEFAAGHGPDEAIQRAFKRIDGLCNEMIDGTSERSQEMRQLFAVEVWNKVNAQPR